MAKKCIGEQLGGTYRRDWGEEGKNVFSGLPGRIPAFTARKLFFEGFVVGSPSCLHMEQGSIIVYSLHSFESLGKSRPIFA